MPVVSIVEIIVILAGVSVALGVLARRIATPWPVLLVLGGAALGIAGALFGGFRFRIPPDLVFYLMLPPLLVAAAYRVPLGAFRANLRPITLLAFGLVLVTMICVAEVAHFLLGLSRAPAYVLGAIVSPPDPVAATAVAGRVGLPNRLVTILEGEGLVNDATALVAYRLALAATITGVFSWQMAGLAFVRAVPVGVVVGWLVARGASFLLERVDDAVLETVATLLTPFVAYLGAEYIGGSGVLSAVTLGFMLRRRRTQMHTARTRLATQVVWNTLEFLVTGIVFMLVGIEIGRAGVGEISRPVLVTAVAVSATAIVVRLAWMFAMPALLQIVTLGHAPARELGARDQLVLGWAGMRGVVSLAAALAIPASVGGGIPFPAREAIILITFGVLFATLVFQGLTLEPLIRLVRRGEVDHAHEDEARAREHAVRAARLRIQTLEAAGQITAAQAEGIRRAIARRPGSAADLAGHDQHRLSDALRDVLACERETVLRLRDAGRISSEVAERLELEFDLELLRAERGGI